MALLILLFLAACSTRQSKPPATYAELKFPKESFFEFTYLEGIETARKVNCASKDPTVCMACALQGEAANQNGKGIYAVGVTIMTRAKGDIKNVCKVTRAKKQFEGMRSTEQRKISKKVWRVTQHILETQETGWTHFWAPGIQYKLNRGKPSWAYEFEKRKCKKSVIDDHVFFNTNDCQLNRDMISISSTYSAQSPGKVLQFANP